MLHIDSHDLTFTDEPNKLHKCVVDIMAMTFGDNGIPIDQVGRTYTIELPEELYQRAQREGFVYIMTVPVKKPGPYQLRVALRDSATDHIGSASQFVDVPDLKKNRLALSGLALRGTSRMNGQAGDDPAAQQEGVDRGSAEAGPAVRHYHSGMYLSYVYFIFNAHSDKDGAPQLTTQVTLLHEGKPVFSGHPAPLTTTGQPDMKRLIAGGVIQLGTDMPPGDYVLQVMVTDALADKKHQIVSQWMDFSVVK
jgi:hypothetical protein